MTFVSCLDISSIAAGHVIPPTSGKLTVASRHERFAANDRY